MADGANAGAARWRCQLESALHNSVKRCAERTHASTTVQVFVRVMRSECTASIAVHAAYERAPHDEHSQSASGAEAHTSHACPCSRAVALHTVAQDDTPAAAVAAAAEDEASVRRCGSMTITTSATRATAGDAVLPDECVHALLAAARAAQLASRTAVVSVHVDGCVLLRPPPPCDAAGMFSPQAALHIAHVVGSDTHTAGVAFDVHAGLTAHVTLALGTRWRVDGTPAETGRIEVALSCDGVAQPIDDAWAAAVIDALPLEEFGAPLRLACTSDYDDDDDTHVAGSTSAAPAHPSVPFAALLVVTLSTRQGVRTAHEADELVKRAALAALADAAVQRAELFPRETRRGVGRLRTLGTVAIGAEHVVRSVLGILDRDANDATLQHAVHCITRTTNAAQLADWMRARLLECARPPTHVPRERRKRAHASSAAETTPAPATDR